MFKYFKNNKRYVSISLICLLLGILIALSFKTYIVLSSQPPDSQSLDLIQVINSLEDDNAALETEIDSLRNNLTEYTDEQHIDVDYLDSLKGQLADIQLLAEQTAVEGPGIILSLDDNTAGAEAARISDTQNYFPENFIIHDTDLRYLINDVAYMAEAIAINGQRITSTSDIRCVGTVIMVNSTRLSPPYEISFIGSPTMLEAAVNDSAQYMILQSKNMPTKLTRSDKLTLPAYTGSLLPNYSQPDRQTNREN